MTAILPDEIMKCVFGFLDLISFGRSAQVCRRWRWLSKDERIQEAIFERRALPSFISLFDKRDWETHVDLDAHSLSLEDEPSLGNIMEVVRQHILLPLRCDEGASILTIPKGLSVNKLIQIAVSPKDGYKLLFGNVCPILLDAIGDCVTEKTYRVVISNDVLETTRSKSLDAQREIVASLGCSLPKAVEALALIVFMYIKSRIPILCYEEYNGGFIYFYTRCEEMIGDEPVCIGGLDNNGLDVYPGVEIGFRGVMPARRING